MAGPREPSFAPRVGPVTTDGTRFAILLSNFHRADCGPCRVGNPCLVGRELWETLTAKTAALFQMRQRGLR